MCSVIPFVHANIQVVMLDAPLLLSQLTACYISRSVEELIGASLELHTQLNMNSIHLDTLRRSVN